MELIFQTSGNSDSVPQIKQKIQQLKGFPISTQTLCFNGAILADDFNLRHSQIVDGSTIHLHLLQHSDLNIQQLSEVPSNSRRSLISPGQSSTDANISDQSGQQTDTGDAGNQPPPPSTNNLQSPSTAEPVKERERISRKLSGTVDMSGGRDVRPRYDLIVAVIYGEQQTLMLVQPEEAVSAVRAWMEHIQWRLPPRYDLTLNHVVMDETQSFAFNQVQLGDVIRPALRFP